MPTVTHTLTEMRARAQSEPHGDMAEAEFRARFSALLTHAPPHLLRAYTFFSVPATLPPWFDTGIDLTGGEQVTVFAVGRTWLSRALDLLYPDSKAKSRVQKLTMLSCGECNRAGGRMTKPIFETFSLWLAS